MEFLKENLFIITGIIASLIILLLIGIYAFFGKNKKAKNEFQQLKQNLEKLLSDVNNSNLSEKQKKELEGEIKDQINMVEINEKKGYKDSSSFLDINDNYEKIRKKIRDLTLKNQ